MTAKRCPLCRSESSREEFRKKSFHYHRCQACRHVFVHPLPAEEENRAYCDLIHTTEYLEESRDWFQVLARRRMDLLSDVTGDLSPIRLLDVGSGHGFFLAEARQRGWDALGIEVSAQPRQFAKRELGLDVVGEDIERAWPRLGDREFDVITFWHVLEHLERPDQVLLEAVSRLGRGAVLVLNSPNLASAIYRLVGRHWSWIYTPGHLQYFSPASLRDWLEKAGVEIVQSETWTDAPNLYFLFEEAILLRIKDRLQKSKRRNFRLKGNRLSQYLAGERHKIAMQYRLARCYERTPLLDSFLKKRDLGHEFLLIARKPRVSSKDAASQHQPDQAEEEGDRAANESCHTHSLGAPADADSDGAENASDSGKGNIQPVENALSFPLERHITSNVKPGMWNILREWLLRVGILLFTLLLCLGLFEIGCRIVGVDFSPNPVWKFHPVLGWTQEPGKVYEYLVDDHMVRVEFNGLGFRDVEHALRKPAGKKRIVLIGDSFSEAIEVSLEETFFRRLQSDLNQSGEDQWEVINLAVGDFGHAQAWLALTEYGLDYSPDIVLFQIFPLNDICNNSLDLWGLCKSQNDAYRPYFAFNNGELELTAAQPVRQWLRLRFYTFGVLERLLLTLLEVDRDVSEVHKERYLARGFEEDPLLYTFADGLDQPESIARGWEVTEAIFRKTHALCQARGITVVPLVIPFEVRVREGWERFAASHPRARMIQDYPEQRFSRLFEDLRVPGVFMKSVFEANLDVFLPTRAGHLNPGAHDLVARTILEKLTEVGLVD